MSMWKAFGRGFDSRRLHHFVFCLIALFLVAATAQEERIQVFDGTRKVSVKIQSVEGKPYIRVADLESALAFQSTALANNLSITYETSTIILSPNRSLVSVNEKLVSLASPVVVQNGAWLVPLEFIPKVLKPATSKGFLWLENSRTLILGDIQPNHLAMKYFTQGESSRLVFQSVRPIGFSVSSDAGGVMVIPRSEDFDVEFSETPFTDGILKKLSIREVGQSKSFLLETDAGFGS